MYWHAPQLAISKQPLEGAPTPLRVSSERTVNLSGHTPITLRTPHRTQPVPAAATTPLQCQSRHSVGKNNISLQLQQFMCPGYSERQYRAELHNAERLKARVHGIAPEALRIAQMCICHKISSTSTCLDNNRSNQVNVSLINKQFRMTTSFGENYSVQLFEYNSKGHRLSANLR